jgi:hypothetical protein
VYSLELLNTLNHHLAEVVSRLWPVGISVDPTRCYAAGHPGGVRKCRNGYNVASIG